MGDFEKQCLEAHNKYRKLHNAPALQLNKQISAHAKEWAERIAKNKKMEHRTNNKYGENIFMAQGMTDISAEQVVKTWYNEMANYNFNTAQFTPNSGHFTQVVWKGVKELGVGIAKNGDLVFVVCNYNPPGNFQGQFKDNVLPLVK